MSDQDTVRRLAEAKAYLERRRDELEKELSSLRSLVEVVDRMLTEKSFKRAASTIAKASSTKPPSPSPPSLRTPIMTVKGVHLADFIVEGKDITVTTTSGAALEADTPPMNSFLIVKVLDPMKMRDQELVRAKKISEKAAFSYDIIKENNILKEIQILNFGDEKRLQELNSAIKWTLRRIYERVGSG